MEGSSLEPDDPTMEIKKKLYPQGFYACTANNLEG